jgi:hypothetical protein
VQTGRRSTCSSPNSSILRLQLSGRHVTEAQVRHAVSAGRERRFASSRLRPNPLAPIRVAGSWTVAGGRRALAAAFNPTGPTGALVQTRERTSGHGTDETPADLLGRGTRRSRSDPRIWRTRARNPPSRSSSRDSTHRPVHACRRRGHREAAIPRRPGGRPPQLLAASGCPQRGCSSCPGLGLGSTWAACSSCRKTGC